MSELADIRRAELLAEVQAAAEAYCAALHACDTGVLEGLFAPAAHLYAAEDGRLVDLSRDEWLSRVAARERPGPGSFADFHIEMVDVSGPETAVARVRLAVGERRFTDYLSYLRLDGSWRVIAKVYRAAKPGEEA